jgi:hypothetical protein
MQIMCPYCKEQSDYSIAEGWNAYLCSECRKPFDILNAKVRTKKSLSYKYGFQRHVAVAIQYRNIEDVIEYDCAYRDDISMQNGDNIAFCFRDKHQIYIVQNLTRDAHTIVKKDEHERVIIAVIIAIFLLAALALVVVKNIVPPVYG